MSGSGKNTALQELLDEAEMSHGALGRAVVAAGARADSNVGTNATSVRRLLEGCQPRWPVPKLVAAVLSQRLQREVSVTECGFVDCSPPGEDPYAGLRCACPLEGTVRTIIELSGRDMRRRKLLLGSAFSAAAFTEPALFAMTIPPAESTARAAGRRVGMAEVQILTEQVTHLSRLDYQYGSGRLREQAVRLLHREANTVLHGSYSEKTGKALLIAVAQASRLAGRMALDVGRHSLAQRYYIQALNLAMSAGDQLYAANVLQQMSRMTVQRGQNALAEQDRLWHGREAVALARAALGLAQDTVTPVLAAQLHALEGRGLALLGDARAARHAVLDAERHYERSRPDEEPPWLGFYTEATLAADLGCCLREAGEPTQAITLSTAALHDYEPWRVRSRSLVQTDLASAHLLGRDLEQAAALGRDALRTAAELNSTRTRERLRTLQRQMHPLRSASPHLRELDERITAFLTRATRRQHGDSSLAL